MRFELIVVIVIAVVGLVAAILRLDDLAGLTAFFAPFMLPKG